MGREQRWITTVISLAKSRNATLHPTVPRTDSTTKNYPAPNVSSAEIEKPCSSLQNVTDSITTNLFLVCHVFGPQNYRNCLQRLKGSISQNTNLFCISAKYTFKLYSEITSIRKIMHVKNTVDFFIPKIHASN